MEETTQQFRRHYLTGQALMEAKEYEEAYSELSQAIHLVEEHGDIPVADEQHAQLYLLRGSSLQSEAGANLYQDSDLFNQVIDDFDQAIGIQPENPLLFLLRGRLYLNARFESFLAEAREDFAKVLELEPDHRDGLKYLGEVLSKEGKFDRAQFYFTQALTQQEDPELLMLRGVSRFKQRPPDFAGAAADFGAAQRYLPRLEELYVWRAQCLQELGEIDAAVIEYDRLLEISPQNAGYMIDRGVLKHEEDPQGAMADYTQALEIEAHPLAYNNRAVLKAQVGQFDAAIADAMAALAVDEQFGIAYATLAEIYALQQDRPAFYHYLSLAITHYYTDPLDILEEPSFQPYQQEEAFRSLLIGKQDVI